MFCAADGLLKACDPAVRGGSLQYTGARFAVCVANGTAALHLACLAAGVGCKDEVITSPITFLASANCALYCGAVPVFADVDPVTVNMTAATLRGRIGKRSKAVIPVHFAGRSCDMEEISKAARRSKLVIIEIGPRAGRGL
jgi:dTDP-4-amino-4,6-dideoxygalactose transaminase